MPARATNGPPEPPSQLGERALAGAITDIILADELTEGLYEPRCSQTAALYACCYRIGHKHLDSWHDLSVHLDGRPEVCRALGLESVPSRSTFTRLWRSADAIGLTDYLEPQVEQRCDELRALGHTDAATALENLTSPETAPEPDGITAAQKRTAIRHIQPLIYDELKFDRDPSRTTFESTDVLDFQSEIALQKTFYHSLSDHNREFADGAMMSTRQFFGTISEPDLGNTRERFRKVYEQQIEVAKGAGLLDRPVDCCIDITLIPFYGETPRETEGVRGGEHKRGTHWHYQYISLSAHDNGRSINIATTEVTPGADLTELVQDLVRQAEEHIRVRRLFMDSEFRSAETLQWLDRRGHGFVVQYPRNNQRTKLQLARMDSDFGSCRKTLTSQEDDVSLDIRLLGEPNWDNIDGDPPWRHRDFNAGAQKGLEQFGGGRDVMGADLDDIDSARWKGRRAYITNIDDVAPQRLIESYDKRWAIETEFRVVKENMVARTKTTSFEARTFFWRFAVALYNGWALLDLFLRADHPDAAPDDRPVLRARSFLEIITDVPPD